MASPREALKRESRALRQSVVLAMSTDPIPHEAAAFKLSNGTIMHAYADAPFAVANFFEV
jgi:hypothetical protein